jgi:ubiquinone/menaquinone biosynthesis C-methylase UbiE
VRAWLLVLAACSSRSPAPPESTSTVPDDRPRYEGRVIAETCTGAAWLERPEREAREQPERVLDMLAIREGMTVADVGAGTGYFTVRLAKRVGRRGEVLATELQPEMLRVLDSRLSEERIGNVRLIRATESQAKLPERCCDLVLLVDVYHELADPPGVMAGIRRALKPTGKLVLVEYRGEDRKLAIKPEHTITLAKLTSELVPMGFAFVESREELPDQRVVIFTRDDALP